MPSGPLLPRKRVPRTRGPLLSALGGQRPPQLGPFCQAAIFFKNKKGREREEEERKTVSAACRLGEGEGEGEGEGGGGDRMGRFWLMG